MNELEFLQYAVKEGLIDAPLVNLLRWDDLDDCFIEIRSRFRIPKDVLAIINFNAHNNLGE